MKEKRRLAKLNGGADVGGDGGPDHANRKHRRRQTAVKRHNTKHGDAEQRKKKKKKKGKSRRSKHRRSQSQESWRKRARERRKLHQQQHAPTAEPPDVKGRERKGSTGPRQLHGRKLPENLVHKAQRLQWEGQDEPAGTARGPLLAIEEGRELPAYDRTRKRSSMSALNTGSILAAKLSLVRRRSSIG